MPRGTHMLSWRVISADGHPVGGVVTFSIGAASGPPVAVLPATDPAVEIAIWAARVAIYLGLFVGAGGAAFVGLVADARPLPGRTEILIVGAIAVGLLATLLSPGLQGLDALALPLSRLPSPDVWSSGFATGYGSTVVLAASAMLIGLASLRVRRRMLDMLLAAGALILAGLALASSGHASTAPPQDLSRPAVFLHGACVAFWIGSLVPLLAIVRAGRGGGELDRFSRMIPFPLAALLASGLSLAWIQLDRPDALWTTGYGEILLRKLVVVVVLLALAAANRFVLVPRFHKRPDAKAPLLASIATEAVLALAILILVAGWRFTPPPRALIAAEPALIHFHGGKAMAQIDVAPVRARGAEVSTQVLDGEFRPLAAKEVTISLANAAAGIEPIRRGATLAEGTTWRVDDLHIPLAGRWSLRVDILIDDFDKETLGDDVLLPKAP